MTWPVALLLVVVLGALIIGFAFYAADKWGW